MSAASLRETQRWFFRQLETPRQEGATRLVMERGALDGAQRLGIYASMYKARILEALGEDFPKVQELLGDRRFFDLCGRFLRTHPSRHPSLRHVGDRLPGYLKRAKVAPWLAELAILERAIVDAFDGPDAAPLGVSALTRVPAGSWGALRFELHPTLRSLRFRHRVDELWEGLDAGKRTRRPRPEPVTMRVWRRGHTVLRTVVSRGEAAALRGVAGKRDFAWVCLRLGTAATAARFLATWFEEGLIVGLSRPS